MGGIVSIERRIICEYIYLCLRVVDFFLGIFPVISLKKIQGGAPQNI